MTGGAGGSNSDAFSGHRICHVMACDQHVTHKFRAAGLKQGYEAFMDLSRFLPLITQVALTYAHIIYFDSVQTSF